MSFQVVMGFDNYKIDTRGNLKYYNRNTENQKNQRFMTLDIDSKVNPTLAIQAINKIKEETGLNLFEYPYLKTPNNGFHFLFLKDEKIKGKQKIGEFRNIDIVTTPWAPVPGEKYSKGIYTQYNKDVSLTDFPESLQIYLEIKPTNFIKNTSEYKNKFKVDYYLVKDFCEYYKNLDKNKKNWHEWSAILRYIKHNFYKSYKTLLISLHNPSQYPDKSIKDVEKEYERITFDNNINRVNGYFFKICKNLGFIFKNRNGTDCKNRLNVFFMKMYYLYLNKDKHRISVKQMKSFWKSSKYEGKFCNFKKEFFEFIGKEFKLVFEVDKNDNYCIKEWKTTTTINETKKIEYNYDDSMTYDQKINQIIKELNITNVNQINIKDLKIMKKKYKINMLYKQILKKIENTLIENSERIKDQEIQKIQLRFNKMVEPEEINDIKDNIINMPKINKENIIIEEIKERKYA